MTEIPVDMHDWVMVRKLTDEEQGNYVVWDAQYECAKCGSIDLDMPPITSGCGPKLYYGLTPLEYWNRYGKPKPD